MAKYDLPAMVSCVKNASGALKISLVAHSQGTLQVDRRRSLVPIAMCVLRSNRHVLCAWCDACFHGGKLGPL